MIVVASANFVPSVVGERSQLSVSILHVHSDTVHSLSGCNLCVRGGGLHANLVNGYGFRSDGDTELGGETARSKCVSRADGENESSLHKFTNFVIGEASDGKIVEEDRAFAVVSKVERKPSSASKGSSGAIKVGIEAMKKIIAADKNKL